MNINDIAIKITNDLIYEITMMCSRVTSVDKNALQQTPSYYMIRQMLYDNLEKYIKVLWR